MKKIAILTSATILCFPMFSFAQTDSNLSKGDQCYSNDKKTIASNNAILGIGSNLEKIKTERGLSKNPTGDKQLTIEYESTYTPCGEMIAASQTRQESKDSISSIIKYQSKNEGNNIVSTFQFMFKMEPQTEARTFITSVLHHNRDNEGRIITSSAHTYDSDNKEIDVSKTTYTYTDGWVTHAKTTNNVNSDYNSETTYHYDSKNKIINVETTGIYPTSYAFQYDDNHRLFSSMEKTNGPMNIQTKTFTCQKWDNIGNCITAVVDDIDIPKAGDITPMKSQATINLQFEYY